MSDVVGAAIVFREGDPPSDVYPTEGTIIGRLSDEHGDEWFVVHFGEGNGYTFHPEEHVLVRPRWRGKKMERGSEIDLLTKPLPLGTDPVGITATSQYSFGPWVEAIIREG